MQSPPFPRYLVPPRSRCAPQHLVLLNIIQNIISTQEQQLGGDGNVIVTGN